MPILDAFFFAAVTPVLWWVFINGLDELFLDCCFLYFKVRRRGAPAPAPAELAGCAEKRVAILVPLWRESQVIEEMIDHNVGALNYQSYDFFLGVYRNDPETFARVRALEQRYPNVHHASCPKDGPTNKADCLNWIYTRMVEEEQRRGISFEVVVQHDAEDIIHPQSLRLASVLAGEYDMVQVPVFPLPTGAANFTHGSYCDEFAEWQVKDMLTRQRLGGFVPSAGVGTAFRREVLQEVAGASNGQIFHIFTLTEDYEIGLRLKLLGKRQVLAMCEVPRARNSNGNSNGNGQGNGVNGNGNGNGYFWSFKRWKHLRRANGNGRKLAHGRNGNGRELIATREYFPNTFRLAVRQKARWVMGVSLQSWQFHGWQGPASQLYWLWRDRKGLLGNPVTLLCNIIFFYSVGMLTAASLFGTDWSLSRIFPSQASWAYPVLVLNTAFLVERLAFRLYCVRQIYGARHALWSLVRVPWGNLINFSATVAALVSFFRARILNREVAWAKTAHDFPGREDLTKLHGHDDDPDGKSRSTGA